MTKHTDADTADVDPEKIATDTEELLERHPLIQLFGDHPRTRFLAALLIVHPRPLTVSDLVERAHISSRQTWYNHKDDLLATGLVAEYSDGGVTQIGLAEDDERVEWLEKLSDWTGAYLRDGSRPE